MSSDIATSSLPKFSAWAVCADWSWILLSLVTPSTSRATVSPKRSRISSSLAPVSSTVSCRSPVAIDAASSLRPARMPADLHRVMEERVARGAFLRAVRHHGEDIGAVEQVLVDMGIVAAHELDQLVLPHDLAARRRCRPLGLLWCRGLLRRFAAIGIAIHWLRRRIDRPGR
jgi:hypothetical protein